MVARIMRRRGFGCGAHRDLTGLWEGERQRVRPRDCWHIPDCRDPDIPSRIAHGEERRAATSRSAHIQAQKDELQPYPETEWLKMRLQYRWGRKQAVHPRKYMSGA